MLEAWSEAFDDSFYSAFFFYFLFFEKPLFAKSELDDSGGLGESDELVLEVAFKIAYVDMEGLFARILENRRIRENPYRN